MKTNITLMLAALMAGLTGPVGAEEVSLASAPPVVVQTAPVAGDTAVDPALTEIRVTYSKAMQDGSWSWSTWGEENFPEMVGEPKYLADGRTCVAKVKLQPGKFYAIWLNSDKFKNFKDADGRPAVPYLLTFTTASQAVSSERATEIIAQSIKTISQCAEGDPRVTEAIAKLRSVPEAKVVSGLVAYLDAPQDTIRRSAVYVLWRGDFSDIGPATASLQKLLTHREDLTRGMAALALGGNKATASYDALAKMTADDSSGYARRCAAYALGLLGDSRAEPVLRKALEDSDPLVKGNATKALTLLEPKDPVLDRTVDKLVAEFPAAEDLSTPEGAGAAWQRANARKDAQAISRLSLVPIDAKQQEEWYQREGERDAEGLAVYLKALADSKIVSVQTWRGELANVVTFLPFPEGKGRSPYSARTFGRANGAWKNLGEDRLPTLEAAKANFEKKKETLWQHFQRTTTASKPPVTGDNVAVEDLALRLLAAIRDKEDSVLKELAVDRIKGWRDALPHFAFELRERLRQPDGTSCALKVGESLVAGGYAAVKCTGPKELEGKYLVLFFAKTDQGWRNCSLRNSPPSTALSKHLADCMAEMQKLTATTNANDTEWQRLLNEDQRAVLAWTDRQFRSYFDARTFSGWSEAERVTLETRCMDALKGPRSRDYYQAINTLGALRSTNGLPALRGIAYERADRNNRDRWMAIRSLGLIGAKADLPELIHLVYHGNINTRWWAQLSLVRITGQNFGKDWNAWAKWWDASGGQPAYRPEIIRWWDGQAEPDKLAQSLDEGDQKFFADLKTKSAATQTGSTNDLAARLRVAEPTMNGIRENWTAARAAMDSGDSTKALASLRQLAPFMQEFREKFQGTSLEAGTTKALELVKSLSAALEKGNQDAAQITLEAMNTLGKDMEEQIKVIKESAESGNK
jgi:HEAT repeat protein